MTEAIQTEKENRLSKASEELATLRLAARKRIENVMGKGQRISELFNLVEEYAQLDCPLLFEGETGVGKKEIVSYLHAISSRGSKELVTVDCSTIPENLIETELFGCKKGAYTDAKEDRVGKIETANNSTLFLDEISALSKTMQYKLVRFVQEQEITRVGDTTPIKLNVRIVAAGNETFKNLLTYELFRRDLYERFTDNIKVPSLKEREEDLDFFIDKFTARLSDELGKKEVRIDNEARKLIKGYRWEGNVRQLMNFMRKLIIRVKGDEATKVYIIYPELVKKSLEDEIVINEKTPAPENPDLRWKTALNTARKNAIERALKEANGNNEKAIALLGISRRTFYIWKREIES